MKKNGFTLTELIVVIIISGIFFTILARCVVMITTFMTEQSEYSVRNDELEILDDRIDAFFNEANLFGAKIYFISAIDKLVLSYKIVEREFELVLDYTANEVRYTAVDLVDSYKFKEIVLKSSDVSSFLLDVKVEASSSNVASFKYRSVIEMEVSDVD